MKKKLGILALMFILSTILMAHLLRSDRAVVLSTDNQHAYTLTHSFAISQETSRGSEISYVKVTKTPLWGQGDTLTFECSKSPWGNIKNFDSCESTTYPYEKVLWIGLDKNGNTFIYLPLLKEAVVNSFLYDVRTRVQISSPLPIWENNEGYIHSTVHQNMQLPIWDDSDGVPGEIVGVTAKQLNLDISLWFYHSDTESSTLLADCYVVDYTLIEKGDEIPCSNEVYMVLNDRLYENILKFEIRIRDVEELISD